MKKRGAEKGNERAKDRGAVQRGLRPAAAEVRVVQQTTYLNDKQFQVVKQAMEIVNEPHTVFSRMASYQRAMQILNTQD